MVDGVSKWFGDLVAVSDVSFRGRAGRDRPARPQRRRQVDHAADAVRADRRRPGARCASSAATPARDLGLARRIGLVPQQEVMFEALTAFEFVRLAAVLQGLADPDEAAARRPRRGRAGPGRRPAHLDLLQGHAPAGEGGPGHRARPRGDRARRAAHRPRPPPAAAHDRPVPAARRRRAVRHRVEPRARRGRALRLAGAGHGPGPPGRRGRLPRHPRAHGRPAPPRPGAQRPAPGGGDRPARRRGRRSPCASRAPTPSSSTPTRSARFRRVGRRPSPSAAAPTCYEVTPLDDDLESVFRYLVGR